MSRTHTHITRVLADVLPEEVGSTMILDAGCGDGSLLERIQSELGCLVAGFDSPRYGDFGNLSHFRDNAVLDVRETNPDGTWPFDDDSVDVVVSNQVVEHVADLESFCAEARRVSRPGAMGVHVFPTHHVLVDPHLNLPFVHRVRDHHVRVDLISFMASLGWGKYDSAGVHSGTCRRTYAEQHADYLRTQTHYRSSSDVLKVFEDHGFRVSYRYSSMFVRGVVQPDARPLSSFAESALFRVARRVTSVTLTCQLSNSYSWSGAA